MRSFTFTTVATISCLALSSVSHKHTSFSCYTIFVLKFARTPESFFSPVDKSFHLSLNCKYAFPIKLIMYSAKRQFKRQQRLIMDHNISYTTSRYHNVATGRINDPEKTLMLKSNLLYSNPGRFFVTKVMSPLL